MTTFKPFLHNRDSISNDRFEALLRDMRNQRDWREEVIRRYREIIDYAWDKGGVEAVRETVALCRELQSPWLGEFTQQAREVVGYQEGRLEKKPDAWKSLP
jgi:hypothetical protein